MPPMNETQSLESDLSFRSDFSTTLTGTTLSLSSYRTSNADDDPDVDDADSLYDSASPSTSSLSFEITHTSFPSSKPKKLIRNRQQVSAIGRPSFVKFRKSPESENQSLSPPSYPPPPPPPPPPAYIESTKFEESNPRPGYRVVRRHTSIMKKSATAISSFAAMKDDDSPIITQILVVSLKPIDEATPREQSVLNGRNADVVPYIKFSDPKVEPSSKGFFPPFFYPDFTRGAYQHIEEESIYTVILTDDHSNRSYAYCYKFREEDAHNDSTFNASKPSTSAGYNRFSYSVLVLVSSFLAERFVKGLAADLVMNIRRRPDDLQKICRELLSLTLTNRADMPKRFVLASNPANDWNRTSIAQTMSSIGLENCLYVFFCLLAEKRVIVSGSRIEDVTEAVHMFIRLLQPIEWPYGLISIIPDAHAELCYNPTPYIYGVMRYNLNSLKDLIVPLPGGEMDEYTIIDVERGVILPADVMKDMRNVDSRLKELIRVGKRMGFSRVMIEDLHDSLLPYFESSSSAASIAAKKLGTDRLNSTTISERINTSTGSNGKKVEKNSAKIEQKIMTWYAKLFSHYKNFGNPLNSSSSAGGAMAGYKPGKAIANDHSVYSTSKFLTWFSETTIFDNFINSMAETRQSHQNPSLARFWRIFEKHAPAMRRNKARKFVMRVFHR